MIELQVFSFICNELQQCSHDITSVDTYNYHSDRLILIKKYSQLLEVFSLMRMISKRLIFINIQDIMKLADGMICFTFILVFFVARQLIAPLL